MPLTRRQGLDLARLSGRWLVPYVSYSYLDATYEFTGTLASPNNPMADANGNVMVTPGRHMPINPANISRLGGGYHPPALPWAAISPHRQPIFRRRQRQPKFQAAQPWDGQSAGRLSTGAVPWQVFGVVNNLFNRHDATYGTYLSPNPPLTDPRTLTLQQPITFQLGLKLKL